MIKGYTGQLSHWPFMASYEQVNIRLKPSIATTNTSMHLLCRDITLSRTSMRVHIKASKTSIANLQSSSYACKTGISTCSHNAMRQYLKHRTTHKGSPLLTFGNGKFLTRRDVSSMTKSLLGLAGANPANYSNHSYRIGVATTAAAAGIPELLI